jgi:flagellar biosynthesis protein FlhG
MVEPEAGPLAAELAAHGTDASPLEAVLEPLPEAEAPPEREPEVASFEEAAAPEVSPTEGGGGEGTEALEEGDTPSVDTFYDTLGVTPQASREQIEKAHRFCLEMYKEGALATYSLLEPGDAEAARRRIHLAFETLVDPERRRAYDLSIGLTPAEPAAVHEALVDRPSSGAAASAGPPTLPSGPLLGADLRRLRESRGVTLREIAVGSKIGLRFLEYIEEDRFELLPPAVYLRGFLHEYARALGVDPRRTADAYLARLPRASQ